MKVIDTLEFTIPVYYLPAIINGDHSGLTDEEEKAINKFWKNIVAIYDEDYPESASFHLDVPDEDNEPAFSSFHEMSELGACDCQQVNMILMGE